MPTVVRDNERSYAIDLISHLNKIFDTYGLLLKRAGGERTISVAKSKVMFPDVVLYGDVQKTHILQGWELKLPDTLITDETFIKDAQRKALALGLNSCFIWNFTAGTLYIKNETGTFEIAKQWTATNHIKSRADVETYRTDWEKLIQEILVEINTFFADGIFKGSSLGEVVSDTVVATLVSRNKKSVADELKSYAIRNTVVKAYLEQWWKEVESEYAKDETDIYNAYAKIIILNWTNRIIFAHVIKKYHNEAKKIVKLNSVSTLNDANEIFDSITSSCDFYSIFSSVDYNTCVPANTWNELMELNLFLEDNDIEQIEQATLQSVLEYTVSSAKREVAGQYTTPSILAEMLVKITMTNLTGNMIDPCCGTGSIPKEALLYKRKNLGTNDAVATTWASDKYTYPLQVANISLTFPDSINIPNRVFQQNALCLDGCNFIDLVNPMDGEMMRVDIPSFDAVLSNLPFIPFEIIRDDDKALIYKVIAEVKAHTGIVLSEKSDIYCFLIFALSRVISEKGRAGFIISNSWLGTVWGKDFYKALNYYYHVEQVHISGNGRWFKNAQVVTTILVLSKKTTIATPFDTDKTIFYTWKKSLSDIKCSDDIQKNIVDSALLSKCLDKEILTMSAYSYSDIVKILEKNLSLNASFHNIEWINNLSRCLVPISDVFNVFRGERRGWDNMFYPETGHNIESEYIKRVLKNAKHVSKLYAEADNDAFCCNEPMSALVEKHKTGALSWIRKYENGVNGTGKPLTTVLARKNMQWYEMSDASTAEIFTMMNPDKRLFFARFNEPTFINQRLIGLRKTDAFPDIELNHALLNSILGMFYIEAVGFGRGLGVLDINKDSIKNAFMLNPNLVEATERALILDAFQPLVQREILGVHQELHQEDREIFDRTVLRAFDIENYYENIKNSLLSMQRVRLAVKA